MKVRKNKKHSPAIDSVHAVDWESVLVAIPSKRLYSVSRASQMLGIGVFDFLNTANEMRIRPAMSIDMARFYSYAQILRIRRRIMEAESQ